MRSPGLLRTSAAGLMMALAFLGDLYSLSIAIPRLANQGATTISVGHLLLAIANIGVLVAAWTRLGPLEKQGLALPLGRSAALVLATGVGWLAAHPPVTTSGTLKFALRPNGPVQHHDCVNRVGDARDQARTARS